jgi:uncharacterized integral membrane protein
MRLILSALALLLAVILAVQNTAVVDVSLLFWNLRASLAIIIALCLVLGLFIGFAALAPLIYRDRRNAKKLETRLAAMEAEKVQRGAPRSQAPSDPSTGSSAFSGSGERGVSSQETHRVDQRRNIR